jgi:hypothetical protein
MNFSFLLISYIKVATDTQKKIVGTFLYNEQAKKFSMEIILYGRKLTCQYYFVVT